MDDIDKVLVLRELDLTGKDFKKVSKEFKVSENEIKDIYDNRDIILKESAPIAEIQKEKFIQRVWDVSIKAISHIEDKLEKAGALETAKVINLVLDKVVALMSIDTITASEREELETRGSLDEIVRLRKTKEKKLKMLRRNLSKFKK